MFVSIGRRSKEARDLVDLLLECHERIRSFIRLAEAVGSRRDLPAEEVEQACLRCERYFIEALPLHVRDEEESLLPRLRGITQSLDDALGAMHREHAEHEPLLRALLQALARVRQSPTNFSERATLANLASRLAAEFEVHLIAEESTIFPAVRQLPPAAQADALAELRARREI